VRCCIQWAIRFDDETDCVIAEGKNITRTRTVGNSGDVDKGSYKVAFAEAMDAFFLLRAVYDKDTNVSDFVFLDLNKHAETLIQAPRNRVIGRRLLESGLLSHARRVFVQCVKAFEAGGTCEEEIPLNSSDPAKSWIRYQAVSVPYGIALTIRNISEEKSKEEIIRQEVQERHRAEQELHSSQEALKALSGFLRNTIDSLPDPLFVKDAGHRWIAVNNALCEFFGRRSQDLLGKTDFEIFSKDVAEASWDKDLEVFNKAATTESEELRENSEGEIRTVSTKRSVFRDFRGSQILVGVFRDVTDKKRVEQELVEARNAAKDATQGRTEFLAKISRAVRTPLNGVIGMSTLLLDTSLEKKQRECAQVLQHSAEHLLEVVNDVLDLSKIESGKVELESELFALRDSLNTLEAMHAPVCQRKGLGFSLHVSSEVPDFVQGDRRRLIQVLVNLLSSAINFTESGGKVTLSVSVFDRRPGQAELIFSVSDTGRGFRAESAKDNSEPFEQENPSIARNFGSTGLGLAICVELVELMQGRIWAEKNASDGTNFNVRVWLDSPGTSDSKPISHRQSFGINGIGPNVASPLRVLLVEDNRINQRVAARMLQKANHKVTIASNGKEAVLAFAEESFDLVLMDIQMPIMDGYAATKELRCIDEKRGKYTPVIALAAHASSDDRDSCLQAGMDDYLTKPITRSRLFARVHHWCSRKEHNGELPTKPYVADLSYQPKPS
jgi:PAS domain S-box-containing protein